MWYHNGNIWYSCTGSMDSRVRTYTHTHTEREKKTSRKRYRECVCVFGYLNVYALICDMCSYRYTALYVILFIYVLWWYENNGGVWNIPCFLITIPAAVAFFTCHFHFRQTHSSIFSLPKLRALMRYLHDYDLYHQPQFNNKTNVVLFSTFQ